MQPDISVIIPSYNRKSSLHEALDCLSEQILATNRFEVIVVDDGSTDGTNSISSSDYPFNLRIHSQANQGSAAARNTGAELSEAERIVFIDDDIRVEPDYLSGLISDLDRLERTIVMGTFLPYQPSGCSVFHRNYSQMEGSHVEQSIGKPVEFTACVTNNLGMRRIDFLAIGGMQDVAGDGPTLWGDVDFGYRAEMLNYRFWQSGFAHLTHCDHAIESLKTASRRSFHAAELSIYLEKKNPGILNRLPMFADKRPVDWQSDSMRLIGRKFLRAVLSSRAAQKGLEALAAPMESLAPDSKALRAVYRWILGGYIYHGFRQGLKDLNIG